MQGDDPNVLEDDEDIIEYEENDNVEEDDTVNDSLEDETLEDESDIIEYEDLSEE